MTSRSLLNFDGLADILRLTGEGAHHEAATELLRKNEIPPDVFAAFMVIAAVQLKFKLRDMGGAYMKIAGHISISDPVQGYLFWWFMLNFLIYGVEQGDFSMAGLETAAADGVDGPSNLESMKSDANARLLAYTDILGDEGIPDMNSFFYSHDRG